MVDQEGKIVVRAGQFVLCLALINPCTQNARMCGNSPTLRQVVDGCLDFVCLRESLPIFRCVIIVGLASTCGT